MLNELIKYDYNVMQLTQHILTPHTAPSPSITETSTAVINRLPAGKIKTHRTFHRTTPAVNTAANIVAISTNGTAALSANETNKQSQVILPKMGKNKSKAKQKQHISFVCRCAAFLMAIFFCILC